MAAMLTLRALVHTSSQRRRSAQRQLRQHTLHLCDCLRALLGQEPRGVLSQEIDYAERCDRLWEASAGDGSWLGSTHRGHWRTGNQSSGLGVDST